MTVMPVPLMYREIVWSGSDENGPSLLRMRMRDEWYIAVINAGGNTFETLTLMREWNEHGANA
jgi:hypothetical protein